MARRTPVQLFSFANGMLDPTLDARTDVKAYYAGARDLTNMLGLAQGGVRTRDGFRHVARLSTPAETPQVRITRFAFSIDRMYLVVFSHMKIEVIADDAVVATLEPDPEVPGDEDRFWTGPELDGLAWTQSLDTMILVHPDHAPRRLVRQHDLEEDEAWLLQDLPLTNRPTADFDGPTAGTLTIALSGTTATLTTTDSTDFDPVSLDAGDPDFWVRAHDGLVRITARTSATVLVGEVVQDLEATTAVEPADWTLEEDAWSDARGWPSAVHLFEGRLYLAGTSALPQTVWGSRAGRFFDFRTTADSFEDEAVEMTLDNDQVAAVEQLFAANELMAFTSGGVYVCAETPVTPARFFLRRHCQLPAARIRPVELDGAVVFIRRTDDGARATCNELVFDEGREIFTPQDLGLLAGSLIDGPVQIAGRLGSEADGANHLFVVNADGSMAVLNTRRAQNIAGWSRFRAGGGGMIRGIATLGSRVHALVERTDGEAVVRTIERMDRTCCLDGAVWAQPVGTVPTAAWDGLDQLEGLTVRLVGDGADLGEVTVSGGAVTLDAPVSTLLAGHGFEWSVETMPIEAELSDGTLVGNRHRLLRATVRLADATRFSVNGRAVDMRDMSVPNLDTAPVGGSGLCQVRLLGWSGGRRRDGATVRVTGQSWTPASILSITAEVAQ
ncbi:MAG: hypothetical protein VYB54_09590 [Pseudomonadota bacterium]|nr:hypothetical protein [Pseudomonadota bacterium]